MHSYQWCAVPGWRVRQNHSTRVPLPLLPWLRSHKHNPQASAAQILWAVFVESAVMALFKAFWWGVSTSPSTLTLHITDAFFNFANAQLWVLQACTLQSFLKLSHHQTAIQAWQVLPTRSLIYAGHRPSPTHLATEDEGLQPPHHKVIHGLPAIHLLYSIL